VKLSTLGRRYATALYTLADQAGQLEAARSSLRDFAATWENVRELRSVFENPSVSAETRRNVLRDIAQQSGMNPIVRDTLLLVSDRRRLPHLPEIVDAFEALAEKRAGHVRAEVVTATELSKEYFDGLQRTLEQATGKQVVLTTRVDPSIIGGVVARVGDRVYDGSIQYRLNELRDELSRGPSGR
jgi:F-type H+-transporting ATPase subunit delta